VEVLGIAADTDFRKIWLKWEGTSQNYSTGFGKGSSVINGALQLASKFEGISQKLAGTSLMAVVRGAGPRI
jgi:hypothetical protein